MSHARAFPFLLLLAGLALSAHVAAQPITPSPKVSPKQPDSPPAAQPSTGTTSPAKPAPPPAPEAPKADPAAQKTLDDTIAYLEKHPIQWLDTDLWQQMDVQGLLFQCEGKFQYAPSYRLSLNLNIHMGDSNALLEVVCDGYTHWEARQLSDGRRYIQKLDWSKVRQTLQQPGVDSRFSEAFRSAQGFAGIVPLLKSIRQSITMTKKENGHFTDHVRDEKGGWKQQDRPVAKLTGVWEGDLLRALFRVPAVPANAWPAILPRQCILYLDETTHFPCRVEWWGPAAQGGPDTLLLQMEFRDAKINVELSKERVTQVFKFEPGEGSVQDVTGPTIEQMQGEIDRMKVMPKGK